VNITSPVFTLKNESSSLNEFMTLGRTHNINDFLQAISTLLPFP